jgi:hypothetical protein
MFQPINSLELKVAIETLSCFDHDIRPAVDLLGNTMTITCCCYSFHDDCAIAARELADMSNLSELIIK